jgi:chromosome segregation ATPase
MSGHLEEVEVMSGDTAAFNEEDFDQLRANVETMTIVSELRRQLIGGICEEDVKKCINDIQHHYQDAEKALLNRIEHLENSKREIIREFEAFKQESEKQKAVLQKRIENALADLSDSQTRYQELEAKLQAVEECYISELSRIEGEKHEINQECQELARHVADLEKHNQEIAEEKLELENQHRIQKFRIAVLEQEIELVRQELEERSTLCEELRQQNNELALALQESEGKAEKELRAKRIELANSMEMREMLEARIEELEQQLAQSQKKNEELYQALVGMKQKAQSLEEEVAENSRRLSYKGEIEAIYQQLNLLNEQLIVNENLQRELDAQKMRAKKAEQEMAELLECVLELKNRLYADQIQLENHFIELEEKQKAMQADVDGFRLNLHKFCGDTGTEINDLYEQVKSRYELLKQSGSQ